MSEDGATYRLLGARARLLKAADELFYEEGLNTVGIERLIERAGVAKASLYNTFGSKDALVRAYLTARHEARRERIQKRIAGMPTPQGKILAIFDEMRERAVEPGFKGCAFVRASAETKEGSCVKTVCDESRAWLRELLLSLATAAGVPDPGALARQLVLLYDGAAVAAQLDGDASAPRTARDIAERLLPGVAGRADTLRAD